MRKKGILLALLVLALTMAVAVATAECAHTGFLEYDQTTHEVVCTRCGQVMVESSAQKASCDHPYTAWKYRITDTTHEMICTLCGQSMFPSEVHFDVCDQPGVCYVCEATNVTITDTRHTSRKWRITNTTHEEVCALCGQVVNAPEKHYEECGNPGVCARCEATGVTFAQTGHVGGWHYEHDQTTHWEVCNTCGATLLGGSSEQHSGYCNEPGVCTRCGATGVTIANTVHPGDASEWRITDTTHEQVCALCGQIVTPSGAHYATCDSPGSCYICGATDVTVAAINHPSKSWTYHFNDTTHEVVCTLCGEIVIPAQEHTDTCDNPGVCYYCQATGVTFAQTRHLDWEWHITDTTHGAVCTFCGQVVFENVAHYATCDKPNVCAYCGATGVTMERIIHPNDARDWRITDTTHEAVCTLCGQFAVSNEAHYATCDNPGVCAGCKATGVTIGLIHHPSYPSPEEYYEWHITDTTHEAFCAVCGQIRIPSEAHYTLEGDPAGVCSLCGATYTISGATPTPTDTPTPTPAPAPVQLNGVTVSGELTVGSTLTAAVDATGATAYSFWVYDANQDLVQEAYMTASSTLAFTPPKPGAYIVFVAATDGVDTVSGNSEWFVVTGDPVTITSLTVSGTQEVGSAITATVLSPTATAYSYWLYDGQGALIEEVYMTASNTYTFTPAKPGIYNVFVAVTDGASGASANTGWFPVEGDPVVINDLDLSGDKKVGSPLTVTVDATGATGFSYWFYDATGALIQEAYMVTTNSYTFTPETAGGYNIFVAVTDGVSGDQQNSGWFLVE